MNEKSIIVNIFNWGVCYIALRSSFELSYYVKNDIFGTFYTELKGLASVITFGETSTL